MSLSLFWKAASSRVPTALPSLRQPWTSSRAASTRVPASSANSWRISVSALFQGRPGRHLHGFVLVALGDGARQERALFRQGDQHGLDGQLAFLRIRAGERLHQRIDETGLGDLGVGLAGCRRATPGSWK
ncbi:hypothetical protein [Massilia sp.]|uniref:hypothetical protein n=1 Tax=Massilia sp. TaxID=1882437 RepID=UPI0028AB2A68|nr:hypothetical protein [Massilia sp.]